MILSLHGGHNASAALVKKVKNNVECWCIESERIDRIKMSCGCERYKGDDFSPRAKSNWIKTKKSDLAVLIHHLLREANATIDEIDKIILSQNTEISRLPAKIQGLPIEYVTHHRAHAALSFYTSNFEEALVIVCDGSGELTNKGYEVQSAWICKNNCLKQIAVTYKKSAYEMGIGNAYELYTYWLGYGYNGCGTTMALASFAEKTLYKFDDIFDYTKNGEAFLKKTFVDVEKYVNEVNYLKKGTAAYNIEHENMMRSVPLPKGYALRYRDEVSNQYPYIQMAADIQVATENIIELYVNKMHEIVPECKNLCGAGGTFLNCNLNSRLRNIPWVKEFYVPTAPGDGGLALGAALASYFDTHEKCYVAPTVYIGTQINAIEIDKTDSIYSIEPENIYAYTAKLIAEGVLVGWCQGRSEFGPRALGNRSLLADPRRKEIPNKINKFLKHREPFRPFAPAVLEEKYDMCFEGTKPIPFMLETRQIREEWLEKIPAVRHVDNSARVQLVSKDNNNKFYLLLLEFEKITGVPVLVNTSLNRNGEPIVDSAYDALKLLRNNLIEALVIENKIYFKR